MAKEDAPFPEPRDKFETIRDLLQEQLKEFIDFEFKHGSVLFIVLGALTAGLFAKGPFRPEPGMKIGVGCFAALLVCLHAYWVWLQYEASQATFALLANDLEEWRKYLGTLRIKGGLAISFVVSHTALAGVLCLLVWFWG